MRLPRWLKNNRNRAILLAVVVFLCIVLFTVIKNRSSIQTVPNINLTTSISALRNEKSQSTSSSSPRLSTSTPTSSTSTPKIVAHTETSLETTSPSPDQSVVNARALSSAGTQLLKSLVNIVCVSGDSSIPSISGSGVIIDSRGIILTAAHVAQFFLLQDYLGPNTVECIVRTGSPARRAYLAEPIYVSPEWVANNPTTLETAAPEGTGEYDFALLGIVATATSTPLPSSYPAIPLAPIDLQAQQPVAIGSYGAQYLTSSQLNYSLYPILVFGSIQNRYTFTSNTVDLVSIDGSAASQEGSSGGGIVNSDGQLAGVITTSSITGSFAARALNAITIGHIRRSYLADTGHVLDTVLASESVPELIAGFASESQALGAKIVSNLGLSVSPSQGN